MRYIEVSAYREQPLVRLIPVKLSVFELMIESDVLLSGQRKVHYPSYSAALIWRPFLQHHHTAARYSGSLPGVAARVAAHPESTASAKSPAMAELIYRWR